MPTPQKVGRLAAMNTHPSYAVAPAIAAEMLEEFGRRLTTAPRITDPTPLCRRINPRNEIINYARMPRGKPVTHTPPGTYLDQSPETTTPHPQRATGAYIRRTKAITAARRMRKRRLRRAILVES